jgi:hypothetical protein
MVPKTSYNYNISSNGAAGDWYWDVSRRGEIIARGLAATEVLARAEAMSAAVADIDPGPDNLAPYLDDSLLPQPSFGAT